MNISDEFADDAFAFLLLLGRYELGVQREIRDLFELLVADLRAQLAESTELLFSVPQRIAGLEALLQTATATIAGSVADMDQRLTMALRDLSPTIVSGRVRRWNAIAGVDIFKGLITPAEVDVLVRDVWLVGSPLRDWWARTEQSLQNSFKTQVRLGVLAKESEGQIIRRLMGTRVGTRTITDMAGNRRRVGVYGGGLFADKSRREVQGLVRTAVHGVSNATMARLYEDNEDIIRGLQAAVTLDDRTSLICMSRADAQWDMDGNPLPGSPWPHKFPGYPPWHFRCRTVVIPILKPFDELTDNLPEGVATQFPAGTRASMDGQVAADITFDKWLRGKTKEVQEKLLGVTRRKLWLDGKITLQQLTNNSGQVLTLEQLRSLIS